MTAIAAAADFHLRQLSVDASQWVPAPELESWKAGDAMALEEDEFGLEDAFGQDDDGGYDDGDPAHAAAAAAAAACSAAFGSCVV